MAGAAVLCCGLEYFHRVLLSCHDLSIQCSFLTSFFRYNLHVIIFILLRVQFNDFFCRFTKICISHHNLVLEHFYHPKKIFSVCLWLILLLTPAIGNYYVVCISTMVLHVKWHSFVWLSVYSIRIVGYLGCFHFLASMNDAAFT